MFVNPTSTDEQKVRARTRQSQALWVFFLTQYVVFGLLNGGGGRGKGGIFVDNLFYKCDGQYYLNSVASVWIYDFYFNYIVRDMFDWN